MARHLSALIIAFGALLLAACDGDPAPAVTAPAPAIVADPAQPRFLDPLLSSGNIDRLLANYVDRAQTEFRQAQSAGEILSERLESFLEVPDLQALTAARDAWHRVHQAHSLTLLHRYVQDALGVPEAPRADDVPRDQLHYRVDHWPILPGYIDYLPDYPDSGLVSDLGFPLQREAILQQHGAYDLDEALVGLHPLEFMLWGSGGTPGAPTRSHQDFLAETRLTAEQAADGLLLEQLPRNRRRALLSLMGEILVDDLTDLSRRWQRGSDDVAARLEGLADPQRLAILLDATAALVSEELLVKTLSPLLNGDRALGLHGYSSGAALATAQTHLEAVENLLLLEGGPGISFEQMIAAVHDGFSAPFYLNLDVAKDCLDTLFTALTSAADAVDYPGGAETTAIDCINAVANLAETLSQAKGHFPG